MDLYYIVNMKCIYKNHKKTKYFNRVKSVLKAASLLLPACILLFTAFFIKGDAHTADNPGNGPYYKVLGVNTAFTGGMVKTGKKLPLLSLSAINKN